MSELDGLGKLCKKSFFYKSSTLHAPAFRVGAQSLSMASILVPIFYLLIVFGGLSVFSYFYRKRTAGRCLRPGLCSDTSADLLLSSDPRRAVLSFAPRARYICDATSKNRPANVRGITEISSYSSSNRRCPSCPPHPRGQTCTSKFIVKRINR